jgi:hypothetical protein
VHVTFGLITKRVDDDRGGASFGSDASDDPSFFSNSPSPSLLLALSLLSLVRVKQHTLVA